MSIFNTKSFSFSLSLFLLALFLLVVSDSFAKLLPLFYLRIPEAIFCRALISILFLLPWSILKKPKLFVSPKVTFLNMLRILCVLGCIFLGYISIQNSPFGRVYTLFQLGPSVAIVLAVVFLKEKITPFILLGLLGCFLGAVTIINPTFDNLTYAKYDTLALLATFLFALFNIAQKLVSSYLTPLAMLFTMHLFYLFFLFPFVSWKAIFLFTPSQWLFLASWTLLLSTQSWIYNISFRHASVTQLMPFIHCEILFAALLSYAVFDEPMKITTWIGGLIITLSSLILYKKNNNA